MLMVLPTLEGKKTPYAYTCMLNFAVGREKNRGIYILQSQQAMQEERTLVYVVLLFTICALDRDGRKESRNKAQGGGEIYQFLCMRVRARFI